MRRAANEGFDKGSLKRYNEKQMTEAVLLACSWLIYPAQWERHLRRSAASMTLSVVYGYPPLTSEQNHTVEVINDFSKRIFTAAFIGSHLVHFFPWLRHLPSRWVSSIQCDGFFERLFKKPSEMEARCRGFIQTRFCNAQRPSSYGGDKCCMKYPT